MNVTFELPPEISRELHASDGVDLGQEAKEAYLVDLYRLDRITHHQLAEAMGMGRLEADAVLKRHRVPSGPQTVAELRAEVAALRAVRPE